MKYYDIKNLVCSTITLTLPLYFFQFDKFEKIPIISFLVQNLLELWWVPAVIGTILGAVSVSAFALTRRYFSYLHRENYATAISAHDIFRAADNQNKPPNLALVILGASITSYLGATAIIGVLQFLWKKIFPVPIIHNEQELWTLFIVHVFASPLLETVILAAALEFARKYIDRNYIICALAAITAGVLHEAVGANYFFIIAWLFWIFSDLYLELRDRISAWKAATAMGVAHFINNFIWLGMVMLRQ